MLDKEHVCGWSDVFWNICRNMDLNIVVVIGLDMNFQMRNYWGLVNLMHYLLRCEKMFGKYIMKKTQQKRRGGKTQKRRGGKTQKRRGEMKRKVMRGGTAIITRKNRSDFTINDPIVVFVIDRIEIPIYKDLILDAEKNGEGTQISSSKIYYGYGYFDKYNGYVYFSLETTYNINEGILSYISSFFDCVHRICLSNNNLCLELYRQAQEQLSKKQLDEQHRQLLYQLQEKLKPRV